MSPEQSLARSVIAQALSDLAEYPKRYEQAQGSRYENTRFQILRKWRETQEFFTMPYSNFWFEVAELDKTRFMRYTRCEVKP